MKINHLQIKRFERERFREIPVQMLYFPEGINPEEYEIHRHVQGEHNDNQQLKKEHFDCIQFVCKSINSKNRKEFIHCVGSRRKEGSDVVLIMKKII